MTTGLVQPLLRREEIATSTQRGRRRVEPSDGRPPTPAPRPLPISPSHPLREPKLHLRRALGCCDHRTDFRHCLDAASTTCHLSVSTPYVDVFVWLSDQVYLPIIVVNFCIPLLAIGSSPFAPVLTVALTRATLPLLVVSSGFSRLRSCLQGERRGEEKSNETDM